MSKKRWTAHDQREVELLRDEAVNLCFVTHVSKGPGIPITFPEMGKMMFAEKWEDGKNYGFVLMHAVELAIYNRNIKPIPGGYVLGDNMLPVAGVKTFSPEQLAQWVNGISVHDEKQNTCCPDFSCCRPHLKWSEEKRQTFVRHPESWDEMLSESLAALVKDMEK